MAGPSKATSSRRPMDQHTAAGIGIPMASVLGRNLFPELGGVGSVYHPGFLADGGGGGLGYASHGAADIWPPSIVVGGCSVWAPSEAAPGNHQRDSAASTGDDGIDDLSYNYTLLIPGTISGGRPLVDLILNDIDEVDPNISSSPLEDVNVSPTDRNGSQPRPSQKWSKNFTDEEDILLVSSWLNVSRDAVHGTDKSKNTYWGRIHEYFHVNKTFDSNRTQGSLSNRWSDIQLDVNKFVGCVSRIEARNQSGQTIQDKLAQALRLFKLDHKDKRSFPYMHCYNILRNEPKWMERRTQKPSKNKKKTPYTTSHVVGESPTNVDDSEDAAQKAVTPTQERPKGRKYEKDKLRQKGRLEALDHAWEKKKAVDAEIEEMKQAKKEERNNKALKLEEDIIAFEKEKFKVTKKKKDDIIALEKEKLELAKKQEDERIALDKSKFELSNTLEEEQIMNVDISGMSVPQQEFYTKLKQRILSQNM